MAKKKRRKRTRFSLVSATKSSSVRKTLKKALEDDGKISLEEFQSIFVAADSDGLDKAERADLGRLAKNSKSLDPGVKQWIKRFINFCIKLERLPQSMQKLGEYYNGAKTGNKPEVPGKAYAKKHWGKYMAQSDYGKLWHYTSKKKGSRGPCALTLSFALKKAGVLTFRKFKNKNSFPKSKVPGGLPVRADDLANYLDKYFQKSKPINLNSEFSEVRQGIVYMDGGWTASGHITLWKTKLDQFEDGLWFPVVEQPDKTRFWDLRPDWLLT